MRQVEANGVRLIVVDRSITIVSTAGPLDRALTLEVELAGGKFRKVLPRPLVSFADVLPVPDVALCTLRVMDGTEALVECSPGPVLPPGALPFMIRTSAQAHVTESYVSVPPALTITDEQGDIWTLGFGSAPRHVTPEGEYAFDVVRNGLPTGEYASRIERQAGKVRIFSRGGFKTWTGTLFF